MSRRKILLVSSNLPPIIGGSSVVYDQICRNAPDDIVALGSKINHETNEVLWDTDTHDKACGYLIRRLGQLRPSTATRIGRAKLLSLVTFDVPIMLKTFLYITYLICRFRIKTVCIGELVYNGWLVFPLRYLLRRRVILYTHGEEISQDGQYAFAKLRTAFLKHAHAIISVSFFCKSLIVSKYGIDPDKIVVISNGVDFHLFCRGEHDRSILPEHVRQKRILLSVSRLVERKGHANLIDTLPLLLGRYPDVHCVIVGAGPLGPDLRAKCEALGLDNHVTFLGSVQLRDLVRLYRASDLFVLPCQTLPDGDTEGFGLVFLEANACGLPVVAGAAGGTVEAVVDGETGLLVEGSDSVQILNAVCRILSGRNFAERLIEGGWRHAQQSGWDRRVIDFLDVCRSKKIRHSLAYARPVDPPMSGSEVPRARDRRPKLLVTVDVEEEFNWSRFSRTDFRVQGQESLRAFQRSCGELSIVPVYLMSYTVMAHADFRKLFAEFLSDGCAELGIHLHSWVTPPFWETPNEFNSYQCNLPIHVERRKLETLCRLYEDSFGRSVSIHRAGRWGGADRTASLLEDLGVSIDLSPIMGYSAASSGGPDFTNLGAEPFWCGPNRRVLTVPASAIKYMPGPDWVSGALFAAMDGMPTLRGLVDKAKFGKAVRFSPEGESSSFLKGMARQFIVRQFPVAVCTVHSTSLYENGNPYVASRTDAIELQRRTTEVLEYCIDGLGFRPSTCGEVFAEAARERELLDPRVNPATPIVAR